MMWGMSKCNKIKTKEELIEMLKVYRGELNNSMMEYLNSLIELEFSVIKKFISDEERLSLSELEIYKQIAIYNIYTRALDIFKQNQYLIDIKGNKEKINGLQIGTKIERKNIQLFDFDYSKKSMNLNRTEAKKYKLMYIGNISLYKTIESEEKRNLEIANIKAALEILYRQDNPYHGFGMTDFNEISSIYCNPSSSWEVEHLKIIRLLSAKLENLDSKKELDDSDKKEIEITNLFHNLLLEDYGLIENDFKAENNREGLQEASVLSKKLVKKMPNIKINDNIKYI